VYSKSKVKPQNGSKIKIWGDITTESAEEAESSTKHESFQ